MFFKKYTFLQILVHILLILLEANIGIWFIYTKVGVVFGCAFLIVAVLHIVAFALKLNRTNERISLFFEAIVDEESMLYFSEKKGSEKEQMLSRSFNRVTDVLAKVKTDSRRQELFYLSLLSEMPEGIIAWNNDGRIQVINNAALELLGCEHVVYIYQLEQLYPAMGAIIRNDLESYSSLLKIKKEDRYKQLTVAKKTIRLEDKSISLLSIKDIGEELSKKETESWNKLTHVLTHEIMNTIAPIVSLSQTLSSYFENVNDDSENTLQKTKKGLGIIKSQSERLMDFTESYRHLSYLPEPIKVRFDLTEFFEDLRILFQQSLTENAIELTIRCLPPSIRFEGDKNQLSQVFINLLRNAIQVLCEKDGKRKVEVRILLLNVLVIEVYNNGEAIPSELQEEIFIPFFSTKQGGTGIGLSVSKQIIRLHSGELFLHADGGEGTTFRIEFPI